MILADLKQIIKNNKSKLINRELYINSNLIPYDKKESFFNYIESLEFNPAMVYRLELCTNDYPTMISSRKDNSYLDNYIKNSRFTQVKVFVEPIRENKTTQPTEKLIKEFGINH